MSSNSNENFDDNRLDQLLASALWPEPTSEQLARLERRWIVARARRRRRVRWVCVAASVAAALLVASSTLMRRAWQEKVEVAHSDPAADSAHPSIASAAEDLAEDLTVRGEDPTPYEMVLFSGVMRGAPAHVEPKAAPIAAQEPPPEAESEADKLRGRLVDLLAEGTIPSVESFLNYVRDEQRRTRSVALEVAEDATDAPLEALLAQLDNPRSQRRLEAALVLGHMNNPAIVERLADSLIERTGRQEAVFALLINRLPESARFLSEARQNLYLAATVRAAEQQLASRYNPRGGNLP